MKFFKRRNPKKKRLAKAGKFVLSAFLFRERFIAIPILLGLIVVAAYFAFQPPIQQQIPPQAASVNNVQSGTVTMNTATETATITAVDPARSIVFCTFRTNSSNASNGATCDLTNATTVTVETGAANGSEIVQWHVVQFDTDVSVMRGSVNFGTGDTVQNVTLAPSVDTSKAFALVTSRTTSTSQVIDEQRIVAAEITSGSNLQITRAESGIAVDVEWQVVTINDATVQSGTTTISDTATSNTATITSVDTSKSFVVFSALPEATVNGVENNYYATGVLTNNTTLTFTRRGTSGDLDLHWFVVEMSDGTSVQRGTATEGSTGTLINQSITSVDTSISVPIVSTNVIETGNPTGTADQDSGNWTGALTSGTNLQLERGSTQDRPSDIAWQVIEFDVAPPVADWSACRTEGGETTIPASSASTDLTLSTSVTDLTQAFLLVDSSGTSGVQGGNDHMVSGYILDANTLRFERGLATATEVNVSYALVECFNNEFDVQRGEITIAASGTSNTGTITSVSQPDSIVLVNARTDDTANAEDEALVTGELLNPTTVTVQRAVAGAAATQVRYEVVEFQSHANVTVQTGEVTLSSGSASVTDTISSVDTGSSWLFCSWDASNNGLQQTAIGCDLTNATTVTFHRFGATAYTNRIRYYVVEFPTGEVTVQRGTEVNDPGSADNTRYDNDITISPIQSVTKAFPFVTNTTSGTGTAFPRNKWIEFLTSITNLRTSFWRGGGAGSFDDNTKYWQIVEFAAATNTEPTGSFNSTTGSSGNIVVSIEVDDADDDDTRANIEYETDSDGACNGPWADATLLGPATADFNDSGGAPDVNNGNPYQVGSTATTRIITSSGSNTVDFTWDSATDLPGVNGTQCLRLTVNDDSADQTTPDTVTLSVDNSAMLAQQAYRWFANDDSTDVGAPMAAQDTITRLTRANEQFRLRVLLDPDTVVNPSDLDLKLQFAEVGSDFACDATFVGETYADVTGASVIAFADNPTPADGATATANVNDPTDGSETVIMASYEELNNATNPNTIAANQDGLWDFSLQNNGAVKGQVYCFRIVQASGSTLSSYAVIPQIRTLPDVYVHCDAINELQTLDTTTGTRTVIGTQSVTTIEAIAYDSGVDVIYAADSGDFGTLDHFTGAWTLVDEIDGGGCADGTAGCIALNDVDGLALDAQTRILWASHRTGSGTSDLLFQINPSTGQFIPDAFGTDVDYLEIGGTGVYNLVDDIAIRPSDGEMFTTGNNGSLDQLLNINKNTGAITVVSGIDTTDFEGSDYRNDDTLMGVRGFADEYREINDTTGVTSNTISLASGPVCGDPEAIAALTLPANQIFGTVFEDNSPQNGTLDGGELGISGVTVRLFLDNDLDGEVDGTDTLVQTTVTDGSGNFSFFYGTTANLVMEIDTTTLPSGYALTTDNLEGAIFTDAVNFGETDTGNNFGANTSTDCDSDGIPDFVEDVPTNVDSDGDGVINACDIDSDNDGITDTIEFTNDRDEDGVPNYLDLDSDNDGIPDAIEANGGTPPTGYSSSTGRISGTDTDLDGLVDAYDSLPSTQYGGSTTTLPMTSTDCSVQDWLDGDSDDDGILDIVEAGGTDSDGDGFVDSFTDSNSDGYHDPLTTTPLPIPNTDGTGGFNYQDLDSDGDGIVDLREGQSVYSPPGIIQDADGDGVIDAFDSSQGGTAIDPVDTDTNGDDDYVDTDSDGDGVLDAIEGHDADMNGVADTTPSGTDADGDGIDDAYDTDTTGSACFNDSTAVNTVLQNTDGTDEIDWRDTNDDNDGFLTIDEDFNTNNDWSDDFTQGGSPTPDYLFFTTPVDIEVLKIVDDATPNEGDTVVYTLTVTNTGPITAQNIEVTDLLPSGVTYVSDTPSQGTYTSGTGVWDIGTLVVSASATLDITATVDAGSAGQNIVNTATLTNVLEGDSNGANDSDTADIDVHDADLAVVKVVDVSAPNVGDTVVFTVTVTNNGPDDANNVQITDQLPAGLTYVSDTPSQGSYVSGTGVWTVGTILNGNNATLAITATVDAGTGGTIISNVATVTAVDEGDSVPGNDSDNADVDVQAADLSLTKVVDDATPNEGATIVYTITVANAGPDTATNVDVQDLLPAGVTYVSDTPSQGTYTSGTGVWAVGSISNGANATLAITATVDGGTSGQTIDNDAEVEDVDQEDPDSTPGNTSGSEDDEDTASISILQADLSLSKTVDNSAPNVGDTIVYTITAANAGPDDTASVEVTDLLPAGVTYVSDTPSQGTYTPGTGVWAIGGILNGNNATLDITATVDAGTGDSTINNAAEITDADVGDPDSTPGNSSGTEDDEDDVDIDVQAADLTLTKVVDDATPNEGDTVVFTITVANSGPDNATNVQVTDLLPAGLTYVSDTPSQGSYVSGTGVWTVGTINNGANATLAITATVDGGTAGTNISNVATVTGTDQEDPSPGDESDNADVDVQAADLTVTKVVDDATPNTGDTIVYTVTIANGGPDNATNVELTDLLPAGVTYVSDTPSQGSYVSGTGVWTVGTINNGANATLAITATVDAGTGGTNIINTATITDVDQADPNPGDESDDADIDVQAADLTLTKVVDDATPNVGDTVVFTVTVANGGPDNATNVQVTDLLPAGVTYVSDTPSQGSYVSGTGVWTVGTINNGANATLAITATVDAGTGGTIISNIATVTGVDQEDPNTGDESDNADIDVQQADLSINKVVDNATPNEGDTVVYTITVFNAGPDQATNVDVLDLLPAGLTYVSDNPSQGSYVSGTGVWSVGIINSSNNATLDITATVDAATAGQTIVNDAQVNAADQEDPDSTPGNSSGSEDDEDDASLTVQSADLAVVKTVDDGTPNEGDTIVYTITVTNNGPDNATNVDITDSLPAGVTYVSDTPSQGTYTSGTGIWDVGTINNGANATLAITATVDAGTGGTIIGNTATVTDVDQADPVPGNNSDNADIDVQSADLVLTKVVDDATPTEGDTIVYTVTVNNNGPDAADNIQVTDLLPAGVTYVSDTPSQGSYVSGTGIWTVGTIAASNNASITITATVDAGTGGTIISNTATVTGVDQADPNPGDESDNADIDVQAADLEVTKVADDATPNEGDTVVFTITIDNNGPDTAGSVTLSDPLPAGVTYVSDTPSQGSYDDGTGVWTVGTIANGGTATLAITVTVDAGTGGTIITNTATITNSDVADPDGGNNSDDATLDVQLADLSLSKVVDESNPDEGDTVVYTVTVFNAGPDQATAVTVNDLLPAGVTYVSDTPSQGSYVSGTGVWTVGTLNNGANATLDITATVDVGTFGQTIVNDAEVASVDQADPDSTPGNTSGSEDDEDDASITVQSADLSLTKGVDNATPDEGDTIVFTLTLANAGPDAAENVSVSDLLPAGLTYVSDTPSQGSYVSGTGIWTVGTVAASSNVTLDITATVDGGTAGTAIVNNAEVETSDQGDPDSTPGNTSGSEDDEDSITVNVTNADLAIVKDVDDATPNVGDIVVYTLTVTNNGPDDTTGVQVIDNLPAGVTYVSDTPSQGTYDDGTGIWTVGAITNGANATLDITVTVNAGTGGTTVVNTATITAQDQSDSNASNNSDTADIDVQAADLSLSKIVDDATPTEGDTVIFTLTLANAGPDSATNVTVTDQLPAGLTYVSDTPSQGSYDDGTGVWTVGTIAASGNATLNITATIDGGTGGTVIDNDAQVTASDQEDPDSTPNNSSGSEDDEATQSVNVQAADLAVVKTVDDATPNEGDTIVYTITLTNNGPDTANSITVTDLLPAGVTYVSDTPSQGSYVSGTGVWTVGTVANGANATLAITATVDAGTGGTIINNTASVSNSDVVDPTPGNNSDSAQIDVQQADLEVTKVVDNATPDEGDTVVYTVTITNNGPDAATNVTLADLLPAGVTFVSANESQGGYSSIGGIWTVGTINNGANATLDITVTVDGGTAGQTIVNNAEVSAADQADPDSTPGNTSGTEDDEDSASLTVTNADLAIVKTVDDANPDPTDTIVYTLTVTNNGPDDTTGVQVTDNLPAGVTYVSDTPSQGTYNDGTGIWTVGAINNGGNATLAITATVDAGTAGLTIDNIATITAQDQSDSNSANNTDNAEITVRGADLGITKSVDDAMPNEGDTIVYTLTVTNNGPDDTTGVQVTDNLPAGVTYVSDTPSQGTYNDGTGIWTVGAINNGGNATLTITATVDAGTATQLITNTATITGNDLDDDNAANDSDTADITVNGSDFTVVKTVDDTNPNVGDTIVYTVTVTNTGPNDGTALEITDLLPAGVTYVSDTPSQGSYVSGTGVWTVGAVNSGNNATLAITATVDAGQGGQTIVNTATLTDSTPVDPVPGNNSDDAQITVQSADLAIVKTVDDGSPNEGDTVVFTLTLTNNGPSTAENVQVTDLLPAGVTYVSDTPSQGSYVSGTGVWTVGNVLNAGVATLNITATVDGGTAGTVITNTATITNSDQEDPDGGNNSDSADLDVQQADLSIVKNVNNATPNEGDTITYTLTINNNGPDAASGIEVTDLLPAGVTYVSDTPSQGSYVSGTGVWSVGSLPVSSMATLQITATVDAGTAGTLITNTATITDLDQTDPNAANDSDTADITVQSADLAVVKTVDDATPNEGDTVVFTVTLTNNGPDNATGVELTDLLPAGVTYVSDTPSQGSYVSGTGVWTVGAINNGSNATLAITATVDAGTAGTIITNTATITDSDQADPTPGNDSDTADIDVQQADLSLTKVVDDATPDETDAIVYTITVANGGPDAAENVSVQDLLPAGVTYVTHLASQGGYVPGTGVWTVGTINNGANATLDITATVDVGTAGTSIDNDAEVSAADQADPDSTPGNSSGTEDDEDTATISVSQADLAIVKTVDDATPNEGDTVIFTLTLTNNGPDDAENIQVTDQLPAGLTYVSDTPSQGSYVSGTGVWSVGNVLNGGNATLAITATVDAGTAGTIITNTATITDSDQADPNPGNDSDTADVDVQQADLSLTKVVNDSTPNEGGNVVFTITVNNAGPDTADNITVQDLLPAGVTYVSDVASQGSYVSGTGVWTVGSILNANNATLAITATVDAGTSGTVITNNAEVSAVDQADPDSTPGNTSGTEDDEDSASITIQEADLAIVKTVDDATPNEGDTVVFTLTLTNNGPNDATNIEVTDQLLAGLTYVSDTPSQGTYNDGTGVWTLGNVNNGGNATLAITATVDAGTAGTIITNTATITDSDQADPNPGNDSDTADVDVQQADLSLTKVVDSGTPNVGDTVTFTITVANAGPDTAENITVADLLPAGVTYVSDTPSQGSYVSGTGVWTVGTINNGANATLDIAATVDAGTAGQTITNNAEVQSVDQADPDSTPGNTSGSEDDEDSAAITVQSADLIVSKTVDDATPNEGDTVQFEVIVANAGPDAATNIFLSDILPAGLTYVSDTPSQGTYTPGTGEWDVGNLLASTFTNIFITATVDAGTAGTIITNTASVSSLDQEDPTPGNNSDTADVDVQQADLSLTKSVNNPSPNEGENVVFSLTLENGGPDIAENIFVADLLPAGLTYVSDTPSQGTYTSGTGVWNVGNVNNGSNATLSITASVDVGTNGQTLVNVAEVTAVDQADPDSTPNNSSGTEDDEDDASVTVQQVDLAVVKTVDDGTPNEGDTIVYTITLTNNGPDNATNVSLTDSLPAGVTYVSDTTSQGSYNDGSGLWTVGNINASSNATLTITATVDAGTSGTIITNTATITGLDQTDPTPGNDSDTADIDVQQADLAVVKTVDDANPNEGGTIVYTITLTNNGPDQADNVELTDNLPAGVTYVSDTPSQGSYVSGTGVWTVGSIANGANATLAITATVDAGTAGTLITNTATVTDLDQTDPVPGNDSDTADITVQQIDLSLTKGVDDTNPNEGDTVIYTITVANDGPNDATGVTVLDQLPAGVTYVSDTPSQGSYVSGTGVWTVGSVANGANATLAITATVDAGTGGSTIENDAEVQAADQVDVDSAPGNSSGFEDDEDAVSITVESADLSLVKNVDNPTPGEGATIVYALTLSNAGPNDAENVTVLDELPTGVTFVSSIASQGSYVSGTGVWTVGTLTNGANATLDITATVDAGTAGSVIVNNAEVFASDQADPDSTPGNTSTTEDDDDDAQIQVQGADLAVTKSANDTTPREEESVTYTITITNNGPNDATGVVLNDPLAAGVTYVSNNPSQGTYNDGSGDWNVGGIDNGNSAVLEITVETDPGTDGQTIVNTSSITALDQPDSNTANNTDSESITVNEPTGGGGNPPVVPDPDPDGGILIANGAACTPDPDVDVTLTAPGATEVILGDDPSFIGDAWQPFTNPDSISILLDTANESNTLYARFRSNTGNLSQIVSDDIVWDSEGSCTLPPTPPEEPEEPEQPEEPEIPTGGSCPIDCDRLFYDVWIINPDGSRRHMESNFARYTDISPTVREIQFEDKGEDFDYNDVFVRVDKRDCTSITFDLQLGDARWHHQVGVTLFYEGTNNRQEIVLWDDSQVSEGSRTFVNANDYPDICVEPEPGEILCDLDCDRVLYELYIKNPDGSVRRQNTNFATVEEFGDGTASVRFEDKGEDFDYNDVLVNVNKNDCSAITFDLELGDARWDHEVWVDLLYAGTTNRNEVMLWNSSQQGTGTRTLVNSFDYPDLCLERIELEEPCTIDCDRLSYDLYITNPDGTERHMGTEFTIVDEIEPGYEIVRFEDRGLDIDHNDVVVAVDRRRCDAIAVEVLEVNAEWHHQISMQLFYEGSTHQVDELLFTDSHLAVGAGLTVDANEFPALCEGAVVPQFGSCTTDCSRVTYDLYIENPDGTERHMFDETFARIIDNGDNTQTVQFEDNGFFDFDYNDVWVTVNRQECENIIFQVENVDASWRHKIKVDLYYDGVKKREVTLWEDSQLALNDGRVVNTNDYSDLCLETVFSGAAQQTLVTNLAEVGLVGEPEIIDVFQPEIGGVTVQFEQPRIYSFARAVSVRVRDMISRLVAPGVSAPPVQMEEVAPPPSIPATAPEPESDPEPEPEVVEPEIEPEPVEEIAAVTQGCVIESDLTQFLDAGVVSNEVLVMQNLLQCLGYFPEDIAPNAVFGPTTQQAVIDFQADKGIDPVGYVGPSTRAALNAYK